MVLKQKKADSRSGAGGKGFEAWNELVKKYDYQSVTGNSHLEVLEQLIIKNSLRRIHVFA